MNTLSTANRLSHLVTFAILCVTVGGCGESPQPTQPPKDPATAIRELVQQSGPKLDAAFATGEVASVSMKIIEGLDRYEDSPAMTQFEQFHRSMEKLPGIAAKGENEDELKAKIEEIKLLASELLKESSE